MYRLLGADSLWSLIVFIRTLLVVLEYISFLITFLLKIFLFFGFFFFNNICILPWLRVARFDVTNFYHSFLVALEQLLLYFPFFSNLMK